MSSIWNRTNKFQKDSLLTLDRDPIERQKRMQSFLPESRYAEIRDVLSSSDSQKEISVPDQLKLRGLPEPSSAIRSQSSDALPRHESVTPLIPTDLIDPVGDSPEAYKARLANLKRWCSKALSFEEVMKKIDTIITGQPTVKKRLAMTMASSALLPKNRFYYFLQGPAGVGKTTLASSLGSIYDRPVMVIHCDSVSRAEDLFGYGPNWKSPQIGLLARAIVESGIRNPILFFDEIDKVSGEHRAQVYNQLNFFLSKETKYFRDNYLGDRIDISEISFLVAGNSSTVFEDLPWLASRMGMKLPFRGYNRDDIEKIFREHLLPQINAIKLESSESRSEKENVSGIQFSSEAQNFLLRAYIDRHGDNCGVRVLANELEEIYRARLALLPQTSMIEKEWLVKNWDIIFPEFANT